MGNSTLRTWILGIIIGLIIGIVIGLYYAWRIDPATYANGSYPNQLSPNYQEAYVQTVVEAFTSTQDAEEARLRLEEFDAVSKIALLAQLENKLSNVDATRARYVVSLASQLQTKENWTKDDIQAGLQQGGATSSFTEALDQPIELGTATQAPEAGLEEPSILSVLIRWIVIIFFFVAGIAIVIYFLTKIKIDRKPVQQEIKAPEVIMDGASLQPLRQWVGTYKFGQDNYDESFTIETSEGDFMGECGLGILDGFASGSPKHVMAFDVWLFDKTDIRTVSMPIMSTFAFEDDVLSGKLSPDATPILAKADGEFDIETTALLVKAKIDQIEYGEEQPPDSYFNTITVSLTAYLKPGADIKGDMPIPENRQSAA